MKYLAVLLLISLFFTENITGEATCSASAKKCATHTECEAEGITVICTSFDYMAKCKAYLENGNTVTIIA